VVGPVKPSPDRALAGVLDSKDSVLLARDPDTDAWGRVQVDAPKVFTTDALMALPGYHPELRLDSGVRLQLFGNVPDAIPVPWLLQTRVTLFVPPPGFDADLRLDGGRVFMTTPNRKAEAGPAKVRVRFKSEIWDITLHDNQTEVCVDLFGRYVPGTPF